MGINGPIDGLCLLGLGLRQRRLARYLRRLGPTATLNACRQKHDRRAPRAWRPDGCFATRTATDLKTVTKQAGVDGVYAPMGCNFADFDNDGWLDFYLGTGEPSLATLVPNRMFKNVAGARFADITGSSRTGHLQKGHGVACGDWDRDGDVDLFIEMGGAINGDKYHNVLFQNPGQGNHWLTVKLIGRKTNRAAIGARIKVVTDGPQPRSIYRLVSSGSSFGANALAADDRPGRCEPASRPWKSPGPPATRPRFSTESPRPGDLDHRVRHRVPPPRLETASRSRIEHWTRRVHLGTATSPGLFAAPAAVASPGAAARPWSQPQVPFLASPPFARLLLGLGLALRVLQRLDRRLHDRRGGIDVRQNPLPPAVGQRDDRRRIARRPA